MMSINQKEGFSK